jgi:hypothetical protein
VQHRMTNRELLRYTGSDQLLTELDRQRRYLLRAESAPMPCPRCDHPSRTWVAAGVDVDDYSMDAGHTYHCPGCGVELRYQLGMFGGARWWDAAPRSEAP